MKLAGLLIQTLFSMGVGWGVGGIQSPDADWLRSVAVD